MNRLNTGLKKMLAVVTAGSCLSGAPVIVQAQDEQLVLEEVVVTAQKREQSLQDVPISMNVVGRDALEKFNLSDFTEVKDSVPNLYIANTPGSYRIVVRGMGSGAGNFAFEQSVGLFVDGVYAGRSRQFQAPFLDIARIEVLRGPQSALFGKNTPAGAVSITTSKPTDEFEAQIKTDVEFEYGGYSVDGFVSGPLTDQLRGRLTAKTASKDGYLENIGTGNDDPETDERFIRGILAWDASDTLEVVATLEGGNKEIVGAPFVSQAQGADIEDADEERNTGGLIDEDNDETDSFSATVTINKDIGEHILTSITNFSTYEYDRIIDSDFGPAPLLVTSFAEEFEQFSQELRIVSPLGETIEYLAGIYYQSNELDMEQSTTFQFGPFDGTSFRNYVQDTDGYAVFAQATWNITDRWRLTGSLRYGEEDKEADQVRRIEGIAPGLDTPLEDERSETQVDPSINVQVDATDSIMLYASYAQGSKGGGFVGGQAGTTENGFEFEEEESNSYEVGAKMTLLDGAANLNIGLFHTEFKDLQVSTFVSRDGELGFLTGNAAEVTSEGIEMDGMWRVTEALTLSGSFAYLDATYDDFPGATCPAGSTTCTPATNNNAGESLAFAPEYTASINFDYYRPLTDNLEFGLRVAVNYSDEVRVDEAVDVFGDQTQDAYSKFNARVSLGDIDGSWEVALYGKNLTDELTIAQSFATPAVVPAGSSFTKVADAGRTIGVQGILRF